MTRINCGIMPSELPDKILLAEHREIKRLPNHLKKHGCKKFSPEQFKLGTGHVIFFLWRGRYTYRRYNDIYDECIKRGFNVKYYGRAWSIYKRFPLFDNDYKPSKKDRAIIIARLKSRGFKLLT